MINDELTKYIIQRTQEGINRRALLVKTVGKFIDYTPEIVQDVVQKLIDEHELTEVEFITEKGRFSMLGPGKAEVRIWK